MLPDNVDISIDLSRFGEFVLKADVPLEIPYSPVCCPSKVFVRRMPGGRLLKRLQHRSRKWRRQAMPNKQNQARLG